MSPARLDQAMPTGNEGAGTVIDAGPDARAARRQDASRSPSGGMYAEQYRVARALECLVLPDGASAGRWRVGVRQPDDRAVDARDDAPRGPHGARAHRRCLEPRPDARQDLRKPTACRSSTSCASAEHVALLQRARRDARRRQQHAELPRRSRRRDRRYRRHAVLRRDRRRHARRDDPRLHGARRERAAKPWSRYGTSVHKQVYIYGRLDLQPDRARRRGRSRVGRRRLPRQHFLAKAGIGDGDEDARSACSPS